MKNTKFACVVVAVVVSLWGCGQGTSEVQRPGELGEVQGAVDIASVVDANPQENTPTTKTGSVTSITVDRDVPSGSGKSAIGLMRFDLSSIPPGSTVTGVSLRLNIINTTSGEGYTAYKVLRSWSQADATWNAATATTSWGTPGARGASDRDSTSLGTLLPTTNGLNTFTLNSAGVTAVQNWVDSPSTNYGLVIDGATNMDGMAFDSVEAITVGNRPVLSVAYTPPFVLGTTQPNASNTGPRVPESQMQTVNGVVTLTTAGTPSAPYIYEKKVVNGRIEIKASNVTVRDLIVRMPATASSVRGILVATAGVSNVRIEHVRIEVPTANQSYLQAVGIQGSGFTAHRCDISGTVDGISMAGVNQESYATAEGNYIHGLVHFANDPTHSDGSHNDAIQIEGNLTNVSVFGNYLRAGWTSAILLTRDYGDGSYSAPPVIDSNWFDVEDSNAGSLLNVKNFTTPISGLRIVKNRFTKAYPAKARIILYPAHLTAADISSSGADRNVFDDGSSDIVPVYNGTSQVYSY